MNRRGFGITLAATVAVTFLLLWATSLPLGIPGEWTWPRISDGADLIVGTVMGLAIGSAYVAFVAWGSGRIDSSTRTATLGLLLMLVGAGFAWILCLQESVPAPANLGKVPYVLFYPRSSGYYWQAKNDVSSTAEFLSSYEELLAEQDYLHIGTHPPGLTLGYHGLLQLCESSPKFSEAVLSTCPKSVYDSLESIRSFSAGSGVIVKPADEATIWLASLLTMFATATTVVGVYKLTRRNYSARVAWLVAGMWPLVPAIAVFHPKSDTLFPMLSVTTAACWMTACDRRSLMWAITAGVTLWIGMLLSLAFVTVAALMVVMTAWEWFVTRTQPISINESEGRVSPTIGQQLLLLASGATGFILPTLLLAWAYDINLINVWRWNLSNHALFYDHNVRTWWKWLLLNPGELAFSVGLPIVIMAVWSVRELLQEGRWRSHRASLPFAFCVVWGLLLVSGKNMGEAARLWVFLMPWVVMSMAAAMERLMRRGNETQESRLGLSMSTWLLAAQMVVCVVTVLRIDGFHFSELLVEQAAP